MNTTLSPSTRIIDRRGTESNQTLTGLPLPEIPNFAPWMTWAWPRVHNSPKFHQTREEAIRQLEQYIGAGRGLFFHPLAHRNEDGVSSWCESIEELVKENGWPQTCIVHLQNAHGPFVVALTRLEWNRRGYDKLEKLAEFKKWASWALP